MTWFVANLLFHENLNEFTEVKICVLELVDEKYENGIKLLHSQIQRYNFCDPK